MDGSDLRFSKILNPEDKRAFIVAADHGLMLGPIKGAADLRSTLTPIIEGRPDGVLISIGQVRLLSDLFNKRNAPSILIRADWSNFGRLGMKPLPTERILERRLVSPKRALAAGANGIVVYFFSGAEDKEEEVANRERIVNFAKECKAIGLPLIVEPFPLGEKVIPENRFDILAEMVKFSIEVGAMAIKAPFYPSKQPKESHPYKKVIKAASGRPVFILGGSRMATDEDAARLIVQALEVGASGAVFGRNCTQAPDPRRIVRLLMKTIHGGK